MADDVSRAYVAADVAGDVISHVSSSVSARGRRVLRLPAREGDAGNPGGAWGRVRRRMTTKFSGQVDRCKWRPSGRRVYQEDGLT